MKKHFLLAATILASITTMGGIYRGDVSPEKYKKLASGKQFDCVGMVLGKYGSTDKQASCVLIGKNIVLTAAHVFVENDYKQDTLYLDKNGKTSKKYIPGATVMYINNPTKRRISNINEYTFRFNRRLYYARQVNVYPTYLDSAAKNMNYCGDLAIVELTDTVAGVTPAELNSSFDEMNSVITGVGYGVSGAADKPEDVGTYMEKIAGQNTIDKEGGMMVNGRPSTMSCDFDHPSRNDCNKMGSSTPLPLEYITGGGDSGGGLFSERHGRWELTGIVSGGGVDVNQLVKSGYYGQQMTFQRVSVFHDWIVQNMASMGKTAMEVNTSLR